MSTNNHRVINKSETSIPSKEISCERSLKAKKCENYANALIDDVNKIRGVIQIYLMSNGLKQSLVYVHDNLN